MMRVSQTGKVRKDLDIHSILTTPNPQTLLIHEKNSKQDKSRKTSQISDQKSSNNVKVMRNNAKQMGWRHWSRLENRDKPHTMWCPGVKTRKELSLAKQVV